MRKKSAAVLLLAGSLALAGCQAPEGQQAASDSPGESAPAPAPTPSGTPTSTTPGTPASTTPATAPPAPSSPPAAPVTAMTIAQQLQAAVPSITAVTEVTEANDGTGFLGQPGQYTSAAWIADTGAAAPENSVVGGAVVEVFASEADAQARLSALQEHIALGPSYNAEYMYQRGSVLLRVTGKLTPEQVARYAETFMEIGLT